MSSIIILILAVVVVVCVNVAPAVYPWVLTSLVVTAFVATLCEEIKEVKSDE